MVRLTECGGIRLWPVVILMLSTACAQYSTSGGLIGGIHSIGIPVAANETAEFEVGEILSERAALAYARDGKLRVVNEESADALLQLDVLSLEDKPFTYTADEETEQYRFRVLVKVELVRIADGVQLLELEGLQGWGTYEAGVGDEVGRRQAVAAALDMIVEEIVDRTTSAW